MKDDSSLINLDFLILILIIIVVIILIMKYIMPEISKNPLQRKRCRNINTDSESLEDYGNLPDKTINEITSSNYQLISNNDATKIIKSDQDTLIELSNNYNNMNNLPYLVDPKN